MKNKPNYHFFLAPFVCINAIATGNLINIARIIRANGFDEDLVVPTALTAGVALYTLKRIQDIWRENNNQNQK